MISCYFFPQDFIFIDFWLYLRVDPIGLHVSLFCPLADRSMMLQLILTFFLYFFSDTPIEKHGYVVSLDRPCHVRRLTEANYSHNCDFFVVSYIHLLNQKISIYTISLLYQLLYIYFQDHHVMVSVFSNTKTEPACLISKLKFNNDNNVDNIQFQRLGWLLPQRGKSIQVEQYISTQSIVAHTYI